MRLALPVFKADISQVRSKCHEPIDLSCISINNGTESRSGWTKIQQMFENVHPNLSPELLFVRTEVECGKGLLLKFLKRN